MLGVAAPEVASGEESAECFGDASAAFLRDLIVNQEVEFGNLIGMHRYVSTNIKLGGIKRDDPQVAGWLQEVEMTGLQSDGSYEFLVND